jgi:hypothetical protein
MSSGSSRLPQPSSTSKTVTGNEIHRIASNKNYVREENEDSGLLELSK